MPRKSSSSKKKNLVLGTSHFLNSRFPFLSPLPCPPRSAQAVQQLVCERPFLCAARRSRLAAAPYLLMPPSRPDIELVSYADRIAKNASATGLLSRPQCASDVHLQSRYLIHPNRGPAFGRETSSGFPHANVALSTVCVLPQRITSGP